MCAQTAGHPAPSTPTEVEVAIVGSGFSGIAMGVSLRAAGIESFVILERASDIGGTWRDNSYPGAACDVPSHLYSFSFEPKADWSRVYAPQAEIWDYLRHCLRKYGLEPHLRLGRCVTEARFDEDSGRWTVRTQTGETFVARALVLGNGPLSNPALPVIPGLDQFAGRVFHSARWDHEWQPDGRSVAVIGTGASAIQIVPAIAPRVGRLQLFQRTPPWILPRYDHAISPESQRMFAALPPLRWLYRAAIYWRNEARAAGFVLDRRLMTLLGRLALRYLRHEVKDPVLRDRLTPRYMMGCKRILISDDYYRALQRPNVELVTAPIARITRDGVLLQDGSERRVDTLVLATGFAATEYLTLIDIEGRGGLKLAEVTAADTSSYLGITVSGFPNLFLLMGPNTGLGHNSMVFMIEAQARYATQAIRALREPGRRALDVRPEVQREYMAGLRARLARSVWQSGCQSWYLKDGQSPVLWPGFTFEYWWRTRRLRPRDYRFT